MTAEGAGEPKAPELGRHQAWAWPCRAPARLALVRRLRSEGSPSWPLCWDRGKGDLQRHREGRGGRWREEEQGGKGRGAGRGREIWGLTTRRKAVGCGQVAAEVSSSGVGSQHGQPGALGCILAPTTPGPPSLG